MATVTQKIPSGLPTETLMKSGYKQTEIGVIPSDWDVKELGEVGEIKMCRRVFSYETKGANAIPFYKIGTFGKETDAYIPQDLYDNYRHRFSFPKKGDILISAAGTIGRTVIYDGMPAYFQDSNIVWIDNNEELISNDYLYYVFQIVKYNTEGGTIQRLYNNIIKSAKFICPTKLQQTAIVSILSDTDTLISKIKKLIQKKKNIKQGAMQELLTGKRRLHGFSGEWMMINMAEKSTLKARIGWQGLTTAEYLNSGDYYLVTGTDLISGRINWTSCYFVDKNRYSQDKNIQLAKGDILLTKDGTIGKVGFVDSLPGHATLNSGVFVIRPKEKAYDPLFFYYILTSHIFDIFLAKLRAGSTISHLYQKDFDSFCFLVPKIEEQIAIATFLFDMDTEIEKLESQFIKYQNIKQGMMQALLTGKIRLLAK